MTSNALDQSCSCILLNSAVDPDLSEGHNFAESGSDLFDIKIFINFAKLYGTLKRSSSLNKQALKDLLNAYYET